MIVHLLSPDTVLIISALCKTVLVLIQHCVLYGIVIIVVDQNFFIIRTKQSDLDIT